MNDPETELLKMEYMKLKSTLNKLKNEPQKSGRGIPPAPSVKVTKNIAANPKQPKIPPRQASKQPQINANTKKSL